MVRVMSCALEPIILLYSEAVVRLRQYLKRYKMRHMRGVLWGLNNPSAPVYPVMRPFDNRDVGHPTGLQVIRLPMSPILSLSFSFGSGIRWPIP